jgi:hypothetical protein
VDWAVGCCTFGKWEKWGTGTCEKIEISEDDRCPERKNLNQTQYERTSPLAGDFSTLAKELISIFSQIPDGTFSNNLQSASFLKNPETFRLSPCFSMLPKIHT